MRKRGKIIKERVAVAGDQAGEREGGNRCVNEFLRMGKVWRRKVSDERKWVCTKWHPSSHPPKQQILQYKQHTTKKRFC